MYTIESERLKFIEERDGKEAALAFAKQTMQVYRSHVLRVPGWLNRDKRKQFIQSYLHFKSHYLAN